MIVNVFVAFHESELSFSRRCSWLKGAPPGTRTLAAGIQKKTLPLFSSSYSLLSSRGSKVILIQCDLLGGSCLQGAFHLCGVTGCAASPESFLIGEFQVETPAAEDHSIFFFAGAVRDGQENVRLQKNIREESEVAFLFHTRHEVVIWKGRAEKRFKVKKIWVCHGWFKKNCIFSEHVILKRKAPTSRRSMRDTGDSPVMEDSTVRESIQGSNPDRGGIVDFFLFCIARVARALYRAP